MPERVRILLLEDNPLDAELAERLLIREGFEPIMTRVSHEDDFRAEVVSGNHDLILADYHLPDFNGMKALEIAREQAPEIPFIFMSGSLGEERAVEALKNGATDYIVKDRPSRLSAVVRTALAQKRDAAAHQRVREALVESERVNQMILSYAAEGIMAIAGDGALLFANPAAERMLGWTPGKVIPDVHAALHPGEKDAAACSLGPDVRGEISRASETVFTMETGQQLDVRYTSAAIVENGQVKGTVITFADITEVKKLELQLEQARRISSLGQVAATIAHEFNNVLMGIQPFAEVIRSRTEDEKILRAAAQISRSVVRGKRVTEEILRFTQPSEPSLQAILLGAWLRQLFPELKSLVGQNIEIDVQVPDKPIAVRSDPAQLQQVLTNLVLNARDAIRGDGLITISVEDEETAGERAGGRSLRGLALLTISDNGCGMIREVLEQIFDPLFTTKRNGTGLGLAVAHQVIHRHGGSIEAVSEEGSGTTFSILLPTTPAASVLRSGIRMVRRPSVRRVVLVEDESAISAGIVMLLDFEGVAVKVVELGGEALSAIASFEPDAVILDMSLPDMNGADVFHLIAQAHPNLPVLFSSGHGDQSSVEKYFGMGHVAFLRKPYNFDELLEKLEQVWQAAATGHPREALT